MTKLDEEIYLKLWIESLNNTVHGTPSHFNDRKTTRPQSIGRLSANKITDRDKRILELYNEGCSNQRIGEIIGISRNTVAGVVDRYIRYKQRTGKGIESLQVISEDSPNQLLTDLRLHPTNTVIYYKNKAIHLSMAEYVAARCMLEANGEFCPIQVMIDAYFKDRPMGKLPQKVLRNAIAGLRYKLDTYDVYITVRTRVGYKFVYK